MKFIAFFITFVLTGSLFSQSAFFNRTDAFLRTYTKDGRVNYSAIRENPKELNWLVDHLANHPIRKATEKAYLINAYNLLVIDKLVKHPTLVSDPQKISNFFTAQKSTLAGNQVSLNQIENQMIRPIYQDPRVHFVLVCGGLGCPPIASFAYMPNKLEMQLENQTKKALNNDDFVSENVDKKTTNLSKIFEWYQGDFGGSQKSVISYINSYRTKPFNEKNKIKYYDYDWSINNAEFPITIVAPVVDEEPKSSKLSEVNDLSRSMDNSTITPLAQPTSSGTNLQTFTTGSLLAKGKFDFTLFNSLYTEQEQVWKGDFFDGYRATFVSHLFQITYGITESKRINVGLDLNYGSSGRASTPDFKNIRQAFAYQNHDSSRVGLSNVGLRLKVQPFATVNNFSIQSTLSFPTIGNPEGFNDPSGEKNLYWATWNRVTWWNQFFIDKTFGKFQVFAEFDLLFRFKRFENQIGMLDLPSNVFLSYFPTSRITFYAMTQHVARLTNNITPQKPEVNDWVIPMNYTASGIGFKYQIASNINIEALYTNFWRGTNTGLGNTFNIGFKFLTR